MRRRVLPVYSLRKSAKETQDGIDEHDTGSLAVSSLEDKGKVRIIQLPNAVAGDPGLPVLNCSTAHPM